MSATYSAVLHERDHLKCLFYGEALNCVPSAHNPYRNIKMCVDTDSNLDSLIARCQANFAPYLSTTEVIKILNSSGNLVHLIRSSLVS